MNNPFATSNNSTSPSSEQTSAVIIYATHSGNAELVAQAIWDGLNSSNIKAEYILAEKAQIDEVIKNKLIILVCSTYDVGLLNNKMIRINEDLKKLKLPNNIIEVVGLGDSTNYDIFCGAADILEETVKLTEAKKLMETVRLDGPPHNKLQDMKNWAVELAGKIS